MLKCVPLWEAWPANGWGSFSGWCMHALHTTAVTCVCVFVWRGVVLVGEQGERDGPT